MNTNKSDRIKTTAPLGATNTTESLTKTTFSGGHNG
jgi:hypothetical protein